jgi:hypothetical protein
VEPESPTEEQTAQTEPLPGTEAELTEAPEQPHHEVGEEDIAALRREAAQWRRRLRDAETERDALREQVDSRDRTDAERLAAQQLQAGADLWAGGVQLSDLRSEGGALDPELVQQAAGRVVEQHPHWRRSSPGFDGGARALPPEPPPSFGQALKAQRRGA